MLWPLAAITNSSEQALRQAISMHLTNFTVQNQALVE